MVAPLAAAAQPGSAPQAWVEEPLVEPEVVPWVEEPWAGPEVVAHSAELAAAGSSEPS